ncbi:winged helix-turn-helix domain-containing protein [Alteribacillus iranensis]|uniref:PaaX-like protein n=1 Tax=Alteribacillus iranensis TaxID=930128 RepID=A0A1I2BHI7_9BACI|nr:winged helix-turn-helix domain-containing protein [Alteribacillus iranensis]SFE55596.1 PaaX-like protein [Alteribacillus iranensis]
MLQHLITSKTRLRLLVKFFVYEGTEAYLRELAKEFGDSTNAVRVELNRLTDCGLLTRSEEGNRKFYQANPEHPFYADVQYIVRRYIGWFEFEQVYKYQKEHIQSIYLREKEDERDTYEYVITQKSGDGHIDLDMAEAVGIPIVLEDNVEETRDPHTPCFLIWMNEQQDTVPC